jgi:hypothetical protein
MATRIYRVVVRGHFHGLDEGQRANLRAAAPDHEIFKSAYTRDGTLTYEPNLVAFSFRYEMREPDDALSDAEAERGVIDAAMAKTRASLEVMGVDHRHLRATATNMANVWS